MDQYIQVDRRFASYAADVDRESLGIYAGSDLYAPYTWKDILRHRCTVVVGASGTGKSREFRQDTDSAGHDPGTGSGTCSREIDWPSKGFE